MPQFDGSNSRIDPYKNFLFRIKVGGSYVAGVSKLSGLDRNVKAISHREGGDPTPRMLPGQVEWSPITMERGITTDTAFADWANLCWSYKNVQGLVGSGAKPVSLSSFRKTMIIEVYDVGGNKVLSYNVYNAWVSQYRALSDLDSEGNAVVIESMTIQHEGWELDNGNSGS